MKSYDVVSVGGATLDIFLRSDKFKLIHSEDVQGGVAICEVYGGKMEVDEVHITSGGGATNTAVSFAKKDLQVACVSEMGNDPPSLIIYQDLAEAQVDTDYLVQEQDETTAVSVVLLSPQGGRSIVTYRGASGMLGRSDFPWEEIKTRWLHVSSLGGRMDFLQRLLKWAHDKGVRVSLNPGLKEIEQREKLLKLLPFVEVLFLNKEEAQLLFGTTLREGNGWDKKGPFVIVETDGGNGGVLCVEGQCQGIHVDQPKHVVDTTGAGDAFASGFVSAVLYGLRYEQAVEWGKRNAAGVLSQIGAKKGLLTLAQIK